MTSKQLRVTSDLFNSPLYKMSVGFDQLFNDMLENPTFATTSGYPPYNVARITDENDDTTYTVTLAVAGFREDDITVTVEKNQLIVEGKSSALAEDVDTTVDYIHKGIAERNFTRTFQLAENVEVTGAELRDGLLRITLVQIVPEEHKPKQIAINSK